jgi:hypothetical protein
MKFLDFKLEIQKKKNPNQDSEYFAELEFGRQVSLSFGKMFYK